MMSAEVTRHLLIEGRVQGVNYRASMVEQARSCGVRGWVRNLRDGRVEALLQGPPDAVQALTDWAHRGPPSAHVTRVLASPADATPLQGFEQRKTASPLVQ